MEAAGSNITSVTRKGCLSSSIFSLGRWYFVKFTLRYHLKFLVNNVKESNYIIQLVPITCRPIFSAFTYLLLYFGSSHTSALSFTHISAGMIVLYING